MFTYELRVGHADDRWCTAHGRWGPPLRIAGVQHPPPPAARTRDCEPRVRGFWQWCQTQCQRLDLLPRSPLAKALQYALARVAALQRMFPEWSQRKSLSTN